VSGQFDKESSCQNYEWHRERALREAKKPKAESQNRIEYNLRAIAAKHGDKAARELAREVDAKIRGK
jgi:hypothetical protein